MKIMKLKVDNESYHSLTSGGITAALAMNDFVSTTRRDPLQSEHQYESRHHLMHAFMKASKSRAVDIVCDRCMSPKRAKVLSVAERPMNDGLAFPVFITGVK